MSCWFHNWKEEEKIFTTATRRSFFRQGITEADVIVVIEKCSKCGKEQAYFSLATSDVRRHIDVDYAKTLRG